MAARRPRALVSWSTGKDAAFALCEARRQAELELVGVLTTITEASGCVAIHGVPESLLDRQVAALGLPCTKVGLPSPCPNPVYERALGRALTGARSRGVTHVVFGDLHLEDIRRYREQQVAALGLTAVFPLWGCDTGALAREMIAAGLRATIAGVDPRQLPPSFAGRRFDEALLRDLPAGVDPCGENGEFHTFVSMGPMFSTPVDVQVRDVTERDGFVFADLAPVTTGA